MYVWKIGLPTYLPTYRLTYLPTYIRTYRPTYLPNYLCLIAVYQINMVNLLSVVFFCHLFLCGWVAQTVGHSQHSLMQWKMLHEKLLLGATGSWGIFSSRPVLTLWETDGMDLSVCMCRILVCRQARTVTPRCLRTCIVISRRLPSRV